MHTCRIEELLRKKNVAAISDEEYKVPETPAYVIVYSKIIPLSYFTIWQLL